MSVSSIKIGDRIDLKHTRSASMRRLIGRDLRSQLLDYDGFRRAIISVPILEGKLIPLEIGDVFNMCFFTDNGLYTCDAKVSRRLREKNLFTIEMEMLGNPTKNQRREYFRLECALPVKFRVLTEKEDMLLGKMYRNDFEDDLEKLEITEYLDSLEKNWIQGNMTDISGGGIRFQHKGKIENDTHIQASFEIIFQQNKIEILNKANVVSCLDTQDMSNHDIRCKFLEMKAQTREKLIKYIFDEQRKRMRNDR